MKEKGTLSIAHITPYYYPSIGGVETVVKALSEGLASRNHHVEVLTSNRDHKNETCEKRNKHELINGVTVNRFQSLLHLGHMSFAPELYTYLNKHHFDIYHFHCIRQPQTILCPLIAKRKGIATIMHAHSHFRSTSVKTLLYNGFDKLAFPLIYNKLSQIIAITQEEKQELLYRGIDQDRISVIPNSVPDTYFIPIETDSFIQKYDLADRDIILYIGHLVEGKGIDLCIQSMPEIVRSDDNALLLIIGPDMGRIDELQQMARNLCVEKHIKWIGRVSEHEKRQALQASHFLTLPSFYEAFGLVLVEAMASGKPVIAAHSPGPDHIISHNKDGYLIPYNSKSAFTEFAKRLLDDEHLRYTMGAEAKKKVQRDYSFSNILDLIEAQYRRFLK